LLCTTTPFSEQGIDSISLDHDTVLKTTLAVLEQERRDESR
jgi:phosphoenolpyruvate synthase/pyruvate phosphate dikinase